MSPCVFLSTCWCSIMQLTQYQDMGDAPAADLTSPAHLCILNYHLQVSNIGSIGGLYANPIVSPPEVAIVALGRVRTVPALAPHSHHGSHSHSHGHTSSSEGSETAQVIPRSVMGVSWGADHRAVDGAALALASNAWKRLLEHPEHMLLNMR
jgi:2-oxoisovalerate dehydrogenase E2 component (dihydrolipoyl transacylase)